jgi:hypothetical protein
MRIGKSVRLIWVISLLVGGSLGCSLTTPQAVLSETPFEGQTTGTQTALLTETAGGQAQGTASPILTPAIPLPGQAPDDIPIMEGEKSTYVSNDRAVSYFIDADFQAVVDFYQQAMEAWGWNRVAYGSRLTDASAELPYEMDGRQALVVITAIPFVNQTSVVITVE